MPDTLWLILIPKRRQLPPIGVIPPVAGSLYPRMYLVGDGRLFCYSNIPNIGRSFLVDTTSSLVETICDLPDPAYQSFDCPSVLLPLLPSDNYNMRLLLCGTTPCQYLELSTAISNRSGTWQKLARDFAIEGVPRIHSNATLLPDGRVVLTGGAEQNNDLFSTGNNPEIFTPSIRIQGGQPLWFGGPTNPGTWTYENDPASLIRNYHSTALLLPDGRVWTAGGNGPGQPTLAEANPNVQEQIEIYTPPYPPGPRPTIVSCSESVGYGGLFIVTMAAPVAENYIVSIMRCGNCTHAWNSGQRSVWCTWDSGHAVGQMIVTAPPNGNLAPPGYWMVFVLDEEKRPCSYAKFILLAG